MFSGDSTGVPFLYHLLSAIFIFLKVLLCLIIDLLN